MNISVFYHKDIDALILADIIEVKSVAWPYPFEEQLRWMNTHISSDDLHFILYDGSQPLAYLSLKPITLQVGNTCVPAFGLGSVCSAFSGKSYGRKLVLAANKFIQNSDRPFGLLFCRNALIHFYTSCYWNLIDKYSNLDNGIYKMYFNANELNAPIIYEGVLF